MKKGKRFKTKGEILKEIDKLRSRSVKYFMQAEAADRMSIWNFRNGWATQGELKQHEAFKLRRRAMNILEKKLPKLGEKLSEFLTTQLPGVDNGDTSIPAF